MEKAHVLSQPGSLSSASLTHVGNGGLMLWDLPHFRENPQLFFKWDFYSLGHIYSFIQY